MSRSIERRIFIVGVPRSGTTLLQSMLAAHGSATSFTESHFFDRHFRSLAGLTVLRRDPLPRVREFLGENELGASEASRLLEESGLLHALRHPTVRRATTVAKAFLRLLDLVAEVRGAHTWVEKTPGHVRFLELIELSRGQAEQHVVHMVRKGDAVVPSLHVASQAWERHYSVDECIDRWNADVALSLDYCELPDHHFVFYEDLTTATEATVKTLTIQVGLEWQPSVIEGYAEASVGLITADEPWKDVARPVLPSSRTDEAFTDREREIVERRLDHSIYDRLYSRFGLAAGESP